MFLVIFRLNFRDSSLLLDRTVVDAQSKRLVFQKLAGALAQQWLGNLVSIKWWSDAWLIESFALFMAEYAESKVRCLAVFPTHALRVFTNFKPRKENE